jgi:hypothetical protein
MLIAQVVKPNFYIDYKVESLDRIPVRYIPYIRNIGEEKYGTDDMCYIIVPLRRFFASSFRGRYDLSAKETTVGETTDKGNGGGARRDDPRPFWDPSPITPRGRGGMVWWCGREKGSVVSSLSRGRRGLYMVDQNQLLKLDIDVDVNFYDPQWLLEKKLQQLHALGYQEEDAWWEYSPSGKHVHVLIMLKDPISTKELFDLQFLLGDDQKRVYFNYLRYSVMKEDAIHFNILYTYKKSLTFSDKVKAILRHWSKSLQYSKK